MYSLQDKHSFSLPARARNLHLIETVEDLESVAWNNDSVILGEGTNTVFTEDFAGQLLLNRLRGFDIQKVDEGHLVSLAAGESWHSWVDNLVRQGIAGFENLALIPGSVGAAPVQNIGAYGVEVSSLIRKVDGIDLATGKPFSFSNKECEFGYRQSIFKSEGMQSYFITEVTFFLPADWKPNLDYPDLAALSSDTDALTVMKHVIEVRQRKLPDPAILPNAGSFFKNPVISEDAYRRLRQRYPDVRYFPLESGRVKLAAAWLIEQCGLKSLRVGGAGVHQRQALVLVNMAQANGEDLINLARQVRKQVLQRFHVSLEPEVRVLGERGLVEL